MFALSCCVSQLEEDQWGVGWFLDEVGSGRA